MKGFDHESPLSPYAQDEHRVWPGIYDNVPSELLSLLEHEGEGVPITIEKIQKLNPDCAAEEVYRELESMGFMKMD
ncbi:hypothetical protein [Cohnella candidum]|uniref:Uncharacterized protein n=1 Tax=Cohnella candidum TaxID=2674991 RepID=A0A3G3K2T0_9BACL|nr:hypothetical protein [Cohnella candidum]AYQ74481.1 hypothetical protein EAV92_19040 [Cohnella candidum]